MVTKIKFSGFRSIIKCPCTPPFCGYCEPLSSSFQPHRFPLKSPTGRGFSPFPFLPSAGRRVTAIQFYLLVHIDIFYDGRGLGHTFGVRVDGTSSRRLWPPDGGGLCIASLRGRRPFGPRGVDCPTGNEFYNAACGGHVSIEYLFSLLTSYTLSRYAGLPLKGKRGI